MRIEDDVAQHLGEQEKCANIVVELLHAALSHAHFSFFELCSEFDKRVFILACPLTYEIGDESECGAFVCLTLDPVRTEGKQR